MTVSAKILDVQQKMKITIINFRILPSSFFDLLPELNQQKAIALFLCQSLLPGQTKYILPESTYFAQSKIDSVLSVQFALWIEV